MSFLAPAMLAGAAAVALPIALHFLYKPRHKPLPWAAMTFLKASLQQTSRRLKFKEYVLLALRCLVLLLLALALARPTAGLVAGGRGEGVDAVFLFDTTASMTARDGPGTRLDRAKAAALAVLDNLPPGSTVRAYACADRTAFLGPVSPGSRDQAREVVKAVSPTATSGDPLAGLGEAVAALDRALSPTKEVYLFTDLQRSGWQRQAAAVRARAAELKGRATLLLVRCGDPARVPTNVAVTGLTLPPGVMAVGSRLPVTVLVTNTGPAAAKGLTVAVEVDGRRTEAEAATVAELAPGETRPVTLTAKLDRPGAQVITATVGPDDLPADNRLDRVLGVRDRVRTLVVDGRPDAADPTRSASHFVQAALAPVEAVRRREYVVEVGVMSADGFAPGRLADADLVILADVPGDRLRPHAERLAAWVRAGGTLVVGGGANVRPDSYATLAGLLPAALEPLATAPTDSPFRIAPESADGFLSQLKDDPFRVVTAAVELTSVTPQQPPTGRTLLKLADGRPLVTSRGVGLGEVVVVGTALDDTGGNWPARAGSFLSVWQFLLADLSARTVLDRNRTAGEPLTYHPQAATKPFELTRPDGGVRPLGPAAGDPLTVTAADTPLAGVYRVEPDAVRFAVAPDLRDTADLTALTDAEAEQALGFRPVFVTAGDGPADWAGERGRREWTVWLLLAVFAAGLAEAGWAWACGRAW